MANSITLSQSLVDDISQKITDGTATAEQVVLYTKGLNQLQTGNDFQAVVIGLSQSAVDAIDSSNAQFQEDSQAAIDAITTIFNTTATDIDTSAANAVSAINNAKDTLNTSSANLETTIAGLPSLTQIREGVYNDSNYVHPYERPAYVVLTDVQARNYAGRAVWYDHNHQMISDDAGVVRTITYQHGDWRIDTASDVREYSGDNHLNLAWLSAENNVFLYANSYPGSSANGNYGYYTPSNNMYGSILGQFNDQDIHPRGVRGTWNSSWMRDVGVVVGTPDTRWMILRDSTRITLAGSYQPQTSTIQLYNTRGWWRDNSNYAAEYARGTEYMDRNNMWKITNETFTLTDISSGQGNICYNQTLNKMVVMNTDGSYNQTPKIYSFTSDFHLPSIAKGEQQISYDYDAIGNLKATKEIDGTVANDTGRPAPSQSESNYRGVPVLCDNGAVVHHVMLPGNISGGAFTTRWVPNTAGDDLIYDAHFNHSGNTTSYGYDQGYQYGVRHAVTNDGKYVVAYNIYYYYGTGIKATFTRVSDGKVLLWNRNDTSYGYYMVPSKKSEFITGIMGYSQAQYQWVLDMDYIFANNADGTMIDFYATGNYNHYNIIYPGNQAAGNRIIHSIYKEYSPEMQYVNDDHVDTRTL